jgi:hypothetical protein
MAYEYPPVQTSQVITGLDRPAVHAHPAHSAQLP